MLTNSQRLTTRVANNWDREEIYKLRHEIYAKELQQHQENNSGCLSDDLDSNNVYLIVKYSEEICGFISITLGQNKKLSLDKYFERKDIPINFDEYLYEVRLLSVIKKYRSSNTAMLLMYGAKRWVEAHGGKNIISICRKEIFQFYVKAGLSSLNKTTASGKVVYELAFASIDDLNTVILQEKDKYQKLNNNVNWNMLFSFYPPEPCYHGGEFFKAIGERLDELEKKEAIINADVLDAWFPPSPKVVKIVKKNLSWLLQTSPPTHSGGLIKAIAEKRGVNEANILPGAGSSDLIFLGMTHLLNSFSKVLILNPCYGEYGYVFKNIIKCSVTQFNLDSNENYSIDPDRLLVEIKKDYDMIILVNPNNPTGIYFPNQKLKEILKQVSSSTLVWIDETCIEYVGADESLEKTACQSENIIVCKSLSKVYALSGARVAYLCCSPHIIESLKSKTPPWAVSLPAQLAAIQALNDDEYYYKKYNQTHKLRKNLKRMLQRIGFSEIYEGQTNSLLFFLPMDTFSADEFLRECKNFDLYLRGFDHIKNEKGAKAIRVAVKSQSINKRIIGIIKQLLKNKINKIEEPIVVLSEVA